VAVLTVGPTHIRGEGGGLATSTNWMVLVEKQTMKKPVAEIKKHEHGENKSGWENNVRYSVACEVRP